MISRYVFVCLYFIAFFLLNRWYDFYQYYFHRSIRSSFAQQFLPIEQLTIKQLQYILNLRGISYGNIYEKHHLMQMVEYTGSVRTSEFHQPVEDETKRRTTRFSSYKQLIDFVDDCKDTIWLVHVLPNSARRRSLIELPEDQWKKIERRLSIFNIQTGMLNCSEREYSNLCQALNDERFVLLIPSINRRSSNIYFYNIYSNKHYDYQYLLNWLCQTLQYHGNQNFDWYELPQEKRSVLEFQINSNSLPSVLPIWYFTLLYRYGSVIHFHRNQTKDYPLQLKYSFKNSSMNTYIYNARDHLHEHHSYRSINFFLSCLTINTQTIMSMYFILLNIYFLYDIYFVQSLSLLKKILLINIISGLFCSICLTWLSMKSFDYLLQMFAFHFIRLSQDSSILMYLRNDLFIYSIMSKWILYPSMIFLHIIMGLCFRWYLKGRRTMHDFPNDVILIDQIHGLCSKIWQNILSFLFSDQGPREHPNESNIFLHYFAQDSLWLNQHSLLTMNPHTTTSIRPAINFERLPTWRFTIRRRQTNTHGAASEYHSDIELEPSNSLKKSSSTLKKSFVHRRVTNLVSLSQQENCYTSESDENNNSRLNSSNIYQCSICLEKYFHNVYICTLPCLHHFHRKCLFDWLCNSEQSTCPLCRSPVII